MCKTYIQDGLHKWEFVISSTSPNTSLEKEVAVFNIATFFCYQRGSLLFESYYIF